ncbi:MAG: hypothetical protein ACFFDT_32315 [Candidatus Hodarchaeota archaeon]
MRISILKILGISLLLISGFVYLPIPVSGTDSSYRILVYQDTYHPVPGNTVMLFAKLYSGTNVVQNVILNISSWELDFDETSMSPQGDGLYSYSLLIPEDFEDDTVDVTIDAYIGGSWVADEWYYVELEVPEEREILHSISHHHANLGDTLEIHSYMPDMADETINNGSVNIIISCDLGNLEPGLTSTHLGDGVFKTNWQVPTDLDLSDPQWEESELMIQIYSEGLHSEGTFFYVTVGDFLLSVTTNVDGTTLEVAIAAHTPDYQPVSGAEIFLTFTQEIGNYPYEELVENKTAPSTDSMGQSQYSYQLNASCHEVSVKVRATKDSSVIYGKSTEYIPLTQTQYLVVAPKAPSLEDFKSLVEEKEDFVIHDTFVAFLGDEILANKHITAYITAPTGIIQVTNYTTDNNGEFVINLPSSVINAYDEVTMEFAHYNGTYWIPSVFSHTYYPDDESGDYGDLNDISVNLEEKGLATVVNVIIKNLKDTPFVAVSLYPYFEEIDAFSWLFSYLFRPDNGGIPQDGTVSIERAFPTENTPMYFLVLAKMADKTSPSGYTDVGWLIDAEGNVVDLEKESEPAGIIGLNLEWILSAVFVVAISSLYIRRRFKQF